MAVRKVAYVDGRGMELAEVHIQRPVLSLQDAVKTVFAKSLWHFTAVCS
jgi:hypothetical protein